MNPRRVRVLHVIQNLNYGGMERLFADIVRLLDAERFESHVLVMDYMGRFGEGLEQYATIHRSAALPRWSMVWPGPLIRQMRQLAPDVVHSHAGVWFKVSLAARRAGVPLVVHTEHGRRWPDPAMDRLLGRLASRRTDVTVAVSEALCEHLRASVVSPRARLEIILNGVDTDLHAPRADTGRIRSELGIPAGVPILGSIGRLEHIKGYDVAVEAVAVLRREWPGPTPPPVLVVAGEGSERPGLESLAARLGIADAVYLPGWRDDVHDLHSAFALFTMGSRSEGTSVSLLEAMSAGLCPVVTEVGGNRSVLGRTLSHRLVAPRDPTALAAAWAAALGDREALARDAAAARARVVGEFGLRGMVQRYEQLYLSPARSP